MPDYQVKFETIAIGNVSFCIRSLKDRQQFSDPQGKAEKLGISSASWPLFGMIWPSALVLAEAMSQFPIQGKRILEIGCGIALASLVLHQRGANITASDFHPLVEPFLQTNIALNHLLPINFQTGNWSLPNPGLGEFDLIIGSDVLYERSHSSLLSAFIDRHSHKPVDVIIVDPGRGHYRKFNQAMATLGYSCSATQPTLKTAHNTPFKGRVFQYHRAGS